MPSGAAIGRILVELLLPFFTALGVVVGGAAAGSLSTLFTHAPPIHTMHELARTLKVWAILVAMGGTVPMLEALESGLLQRQVTVLARQVLVLAVGFAGAHTGQWLLVRLTGTE